MKGDMIVKVVNAYGSEVPVSIDLQHAAAAPSKAQLITLSAPSLTDENSFEHPMQYIPVSTRVAASGNHVSLTLKPYSINVLRVRAGKK